MNTVVHPALCRAHGQKRLIYKCISLHLNRQHEFQYFPDLQSVDFAGPFSFKVALPSSWILQRPAQGGSNFVPFFQTGPPYAGCCTNRIRRHKKPLPKNS
jgi:hypothetical protein